MAAAQKKFVQVVNRMEEERRQERARLEENLKREIARYDEVNSTLEAVRAEADLQLAEAATKLQALADAKQAQEASHASEVTELKQALEAQIAHERAVSLAMSSEMDADHELEIQKAVTELAAASADFEKQRQSYQAQTSTAQRKLEASRAELEEKDEKLATKAAEMREGQEVLREHQETIEQLKLEAAEREKRCVALRGENEQLSKFCQVLEFRLGVSEKQHSETKEKLEQAASSEKALESVLLAEGEKREHAERQVKQLLARQALLLDKVKKAEIRATDAETFQRVTCKDLYAILKQPDRSFDKVVAFVEARMEFADRLGLTPGEQLVKEPDERSLIEIRRQRDQLQSALDKGKSEAKRNEQKTQVALAHMRADLKSLLDVNRELRAQNKKLTLQVNAQKHVKFSADQRSVSDQHPLSRPSTVPNLRHRERDGAAPAATFSSSMQISEGSLFGHAERQALENQRLRENLLFLTAGQGRGKTSNSSTMPLPPV